MATESVGVRELQQHASDVLRRVASGETVAITVRGRMVAHLVPALPDGLESLLATGRARAATVDPSDLPPPLPTSVDAPRTLGELLADTRHDER